jgi:hypothetical protein
MVRYKVEIIFLYDFKCTKKYLMLLGIFLRFKKLWRVISPLKSDTYQNVIFFKEIHF